MLSFDPAPVTLPTAYPAGAVTVRAPGRLHLGFLDPSASLGRPYGSLGLVLDGFETVVELGPAAFDVVTANTPAARREIDRASAHLDVLRQRTGLAEPLHLRLFDALPAHAGFGSGTQLALAIGRAFAVRHGLDLSSATLAHWLGRGVRSGVGIAGFDHGGLLLDGGPNAAGRPAPLLSHLPFPESWRVVVVQDGSQHGLHGSKERQLMARLAPMPRDVAADICHQVLMQVLPGAASGEFGIFAAGVTRVQALLGAHFAPAQGGAAYTSAAVGQFVQWIGEASRGRRRADGDTDHGAAVGQSSWGPTGFAILPNQAQAEAAVAAARSAGLLRPQLDVRIVRARASGAVVVGAAPAAAATR